MSTNTDVELWMPAFFINLAVGRTLVAKGIITKDELKAELLKMGKGKDVDPVLDRALADAISAVANW